MASTDCTRWALAGSSEDATDDPAPGGRGLESIGGLAPTSAALVGEPIGTAARPACHPSVEVGRVPEGDGQPPD